jgi:SMI1-KNR4 cell-wall
MEARLVLEQLKALGHLSHERLLADEQQVEMAESELNVRYPATYKLFLTAYSTVEFGTLEMLSVTTEPNDYLNLVTVTKEAWKYGLPKYLYPFVEDNGDYYCFDTLSARPDYQVKYWSHNGPSNEYWTNFVAWIEQCWIGETQNRQTS